ncbi:MAG: tetratricopeptide repeat protein [Saprospiraceae bacterium]|nr:tetratricopeptide repeat protein [Bacteroidia bacterium]NNF20587.1 tetratricopeptide repeat protein [Saprospiraceae bacterium]
MRKLVFVFSFLASMNLLSQDSRLANQYYQSGEYEQAASVYKALFDKTQNAYFYFTRYIDCMIAMDDYEGAEREINKQIKKDPKQMQLYVTYGNLLERQYLPDQADEQYRKAIDNIPPDVSVINNLGNAFTRLTKYDMAIEAFRKGQALLSNDYLFSYNLADLYRRKGDSKRMIEYYLKVAAQNPTQVEQYKTQFQRNLSNEGDLDELRRQLYDKIQSEPENQVYPELLEWVFIEKKEYNKALRQARSLDRKLNETGERVMKVGDIAYVDGDYDTAIRAYEYVIKDKGLNNSLYVDAKRAILKSKRNKITRTFNYSSTDLDTLEIEYEKFIDEFGINPRTEHLVKEYADFLAIYKNDLDKAIRVLKNLVELASINKYVKANSKIALADYYLMKGEIWEATLLYSQVEKDFKEDYLGEVSRFRNAKLSYYAGKFEWAQAQFDILKAATSRLISNDAIDLSVFIMDNMGLDTTDVPLKMFSTAELYTVQNKYDEAFAILDSISIMFPKHSLEDDILYQKANLHYKLKDIESAKVLYKKVYEDFPEEIRADNSLMKLAEILEIHEDKPEEAMGLYEKLFIEFSSSTFAVEARKRYRILRGDNIQ